MKQKEMDWIYEVALGHGKLNLKEILKMKDSNDVITRKELNAALNRHIVLVEDRDKTTGEEIDTLHKRVVDLIIRQRKFEALMTKFALMTAGGFVVLVVLHVFNILST